MFLKNGNAIADELPNTYLVQPLTAVRNTDLATRYSDLFYLFVTDYI